jgi:hypothetical protein
MILDTACENDYTIIRKTNIFFIVAEQAPSREALRMVVNGGAGI